MSTKDAWRAQARALRADLARKDRGFALAIADHAHALGLPPRTHVGSYWPVRDEADPRGLAAALAAKGHPIFLPAVTARGAPLVFRRWQEGDRLQPGPYEIPEPLPTAERGVPAAVLVPLLAFDAEGYRLGYGGGYYDRTLAALRAGNPGLVAIGVAYAGQQVAVLPRDPHDRRLDLVITERGVRHFRHR